jgi:anthranilate synthase component 1
VIWFGHRPSELRTILPLSHRKLTFNFKRLHPKQSPLSIFSNLEEVFDYTCILESAIGPKRLAEFSFVVFDPSIVLTAKKGLVDLEIRRSTSSSSNNNNNNVAKGSSSSGGEGGRQDRISIMTKDPLRVLEQIVETTPSVNEAPFRFLGGAIGYISYDSVGYWEDSLLGHSRCPPSEFPDIEFHFYEEGIVFDHRQEKTYYFFSDRIKDRFNDIREICERGGASKESSYHYNYKEEYCDENERERRIVSNRAIRFTKPQINVTKDYFESSVEKAKDYIRRGDIFQVVLSKRFDFEIKGDLLRFYYELRKLNPSPYMYFLNMSKDTKIVGSSPEMLLRIEKRILETFPIAGTRPCVKDERENKRLRNELLKDPKERAEHIMLVDLARNDIGKVSEFGSVSVPDFMEVHQFSHVQHIVSRVTGRLREGLTSFDAIRAVFPAGTVSGAPKVRAMEIIDELETEKRGPYAGAVGYFSFNKNIDSAITIRTLVARGNKASIQVGAGIVADSEPEREWYETEHKAAALFKALDLSKKEGGA